MYNFQSEEFKKYFLLEFTKELIRNSASVEIYKLINLLKQEEETLKKGELKEKRQIKSLVKRRVKQEENYAISIKKEAGKEGDPIFTGYKKEIIKQDLSSKKTLFIPEPMLPERLRYLRPISTKGEIDLGKINNFIQDPVIRMIECNGPNQGVIIAGSMGKKETTITLTKEEIEEIIKKFSEEAKIPLQEGFFKVAVKKLIISAIYSESVGSKFIIQKLLYNPRENSLIGNQNMLLNPSSK